MGWNLHPVLDASRFGLRELEDDQVDGVWCEEELVCRVEDLLAAKVVELELQAVQPLGHELLVLAEADGDGANLDAVGGDIHLVLAALEGGDKMGLTHLGR